MSRMNAILVVLTWTVALAPLPVRAFALTQDGQHDSHVLAAAVAWQLDPFILKGLLVHESGMRPDAVNPRTGATGIAQMTCGGRAAVTRLRRARGASAFTRADALVPARAIPAAARLLAHHVRECGTTARALTAYNRGRCGAPSGFVRQVYRQANRLRTSAGLPPLRLPREHAGRGPET